MRKLQCNTCGGTYADTEPDGMLYFHACPPQSFDPTGKAIPFANPRNENILTDEKGTVLGIVSVGLGVTVLSVS